MTDRFSDAIATFDGSSYDALEEALAPGPPSADELAGFVVLLEVGDQAAQLAVSWLIARCTVKHYAFLPGERRRIIGVLADPGRDITVRLHLCKAIRELRTPPDVAGVVANALDELAAAAEREVRSAVLDAFDGLIKRFPKLEDRARAAIERALVDKAPSVRAEARILQRRYTD